MSAEGFKEQVRRVSIEGGEEERDLVVGVCITRSAKDPKGKETTEYLLVQRDIPNGQWYFPGGKVRKGETMKEALKREMEEELGLRYGIDYPEKFENFTAGAYDIKDKNLAIVNVTIPRDSLNAQPRLQNTDAIKKMIWTADPLSYDLTAQAKDILAARTSGTDLPWRNDMRNISHLEPRLPTLGSEDSGTPP